MTLWFQLLRAVALTADGASLASLHIGPIAITPEAAIVALLPHCAVRVVDFAVFVHSFVLVPSLFRRFPDFLFMVPDMKL